MLALALVEGFGRGRGIAGPHPHVSTGSAHESCDASDVSLKVKVKKFGFVQFNVVSEKFIKSISPQHPFIYRSNSQLRVKLPQFF